jgi:iron complex outermembrane receptor protein
LPPAGGDLINFNQLKTQSASLFSQIDWNFAPQLTLVAGGRIIVERQEYTYSTSLIRNDRDNYIDDVVLAPLPAWQTDAGTPMLDPYHDKRHDTLWAGKIQLEYRPNDDTLIYAGVNRGVKGGAYNAKYFTGPPFLAESEIPYKAETLISYEAGVKSTLLDGAIVANLSAFYYDYQDYQAFLFLRSSGLIRNNDATNYGIEGSLAIKPTDRLSVDLSGSIFRPKVKDVPIAAATATAPAVIRDVEPAFAPREQVTVRMSWTPPVADDAITLSANANYTGRFFNNLRNFTSNVTNDYILAGASAEWELGDGFTATAALDNIFDKRVNVVGFDLADFCGCRHESYNRPRTWRVSLRYEL